MGIDYIGQTLGGRYEVLSLIATGGMGDVYKGRDRKLDSQVAIKFLKAECAVSLDLKRRFEREVRATSIVTHENVVKISDVGETDSQIPWLVMEYLEGESLATYLQKENPLHVEKACYILEQILAGLFAIHQQNIVHRDLHLSNIIVNERVDSSLFVKLIDFGISKNVDDETVITVSGDTLGNPNYIAPEQCLRADAVDFRSDLYSVGVIAYRMLVGSPPLTVRSKDILLKIRPVPPREIVADIPIQLNDLIVQLLHKNPEKRPANADIVLKQIKIISARAKTDASFICSDSPPPQPKGQDNGTSELQLHPGISPPPQQDSILENRYKIISLLGKGGMGEVYLGKDVKMNKAVAVKFLLNSEDTTPDSDIRFEKEALVVSPINHVNVVSVMDIGKNPHGVQWMVMEYLDGISLAQKLKKNAPLKIPLARSILKQILTGLAVIHNHGIVHRDIKPSNIILIKNLDASFQVKLIDFGISKSISESTLSQITRSGTALGTPAYMSPEQFIDASRTDCRSDLYSVGVTAYHMMVGQLPFNQVHEILLPTLPLPPAEVIPGFPEELNDLLMKLLSNNPDDRPQSAVAALQMLLSQESQSPNRKGFNWKIPVVFTAFAVILSILIFQWDTWSYAPSPDTINPPDEKSRPESGTGEVNANKIVSRPSEKTNSEKDFSPEQVVDSKKVDSKAETVDTEEQTAHQTAQSPVTENATKRRRTSSKAQAKTPQRESPPPAVKPTVDEPHDTSTMHEESDETTTTNTSPDPPLDVNDLIWE